MSLQAVGYEPHGSPCSSLGSSLSRKRSREYAGFAEFTTPPPSRRSSREADDRTVSKCPMIYHTPPASDTGSPAIKAESFPGSLPLIETDDSLCVRLKDEAEQQSDGNSPVKLPGLDQFDQGVRALGDSKSSPTTNTSPQTLPSFKAVFSPQLPALQLYAATEPSPSTSASTSTSYYPVTSSSTTNPHPYSSPVYQTPRTALTPPFSAFTTPDLPPEELYPHVQPKVRNKHCNKKYTVEEGDFIIYLWHDKKLKWEQVRNEFANIFGREPYRTTQGLQAWYYRMNGVIPCWDKDGYLIFDNDDILEPRNRQIKVRDQERGEVDPEPLGLAQRYPERGMAYRWVEHKDKVAMSDWAAKRIQQFNERRERRRQKEDRRAAGLQEATAPRHIQQAAGPSYRSYL